MPYQVQQIIEGRGAPVCVTADETVSRALTLMIEHDFSQLPVIRQEGAYSTPLGLITYEGVLRGIRNFGARISDLKVGDVMVTVPIRTVEDDLFDILDLLKEQNAVLVRDFHGPDLVGIVTSFDAAEYFRDRTEDLMRVEDIELMVKDFIKAAYTGPDGQLDETKLAASIARVTSNANKGPSDSEKKKAFDDLSLGEYNGLLLMKETWPLIEPLLDMQRDFVFELLDGVRKIRNILAHFRADISAEQRDRLRFGAEWLSRRQDTYQAQLQAAHLTNAIELALAQGNGIEAEVVRDNEIVYGTTPIPEPGLTGFSVTESATSGGRLAPLADWLQSQPGRVDQVQLNFGEIEKIIGSELPVSARKHRAWWANDAEAHSHSQQWLDAGWRSMYVNLTEGRVTYSRMREREKAYIAFFGKLLNELRRLSDVPIKDISPDGANWIVIWTLPLSGGSAGAFNFSFTRDKRLRVELYLDLGDQAQTKTAFDVLFVHKDEIEAKVGTIEWERLDSRRASRLAIYRGGQVTDESRKLTELRKWAAETMIKFYHTLVELADRAIVDAKTR